MSRWHGVLMSTLLLTTLLFAPSDVVNGEETASAPGCFDGIVNGDFEGTGGWTINPSPATPSYAPAPNRTGTAMRLGIAEVPNRNAYSSIEQTISIPADAISAQLRWDFFAIAKGPIDADKQQIIILDPITRGTIEILWEERRNDQIWLTAAADMMIYKGQTITIYFNVFNDGVGAVDQATAMHLDNVILEVCVGITTTPTTTTTATPATITPTPTPTPTATPNVQITFIEYDPPGSDLNGEYVLIQNPTGAAVNMTNWTLRDEANHTFTFPSFTLNSGASVKVWTKSGTNTATDLYWGWSSAIWNNDGDIAYLRDNMSVLIDEYSYLLTPTPTPTPTSAPALTPTPTLVYTPTPTATATSFTVTPTASPIPTATPTPSVTPIVGDCYEMLFNGGFEQDTDWQLHRTPLWPTYAGPPNPVRSGARSMMLGNPSLPEAVSYSSARQEAGIPADAQTARIEFWYWAQTDDTNGGDRQQLLLLDPVSYARIADLWRPSPLHNERSWQHMAIDLTPYRGQSVLVYFNAFNDGDGRRTVLFLDDVSLLACYPFATGTPTITAMEGAMAEAVAAATPAFMPPTIESGVAPAGRTATPAFMPPVAEGGVAAAVETATPRPPPAPTLGPAVTAVAVEEAAENVAPTPEAAASTTAAARIGEAILQRWPIVIGTLAGVFILFLIVFVVWWFRRPGAILRQG